MDNHFICTVLLITYNQKDSIEKALQSVLAQKTNYKYKIHIFDDCSTDGTDEIIMEYHKKYPDIIIPFIASKNRGSSDNFWAAYKSVDTKYCAILEGDDYWCDAEKLEAQIIALEEHQNCSSCAANTLIQNIGDKNDVVESGELMVSEKLIKENNIFNHEFLRKKYCGFINHLSSRMINMSLVDLNEIKDQESFCYDNAQFFYLLTKGPIYMLNRVVSVRRMTGRGVFSSVNAIKKIRMLINVLVEVNKQTNYQVEDIIYEHLQNYMGYFLFIANFLDKDKIVSSIPILRDMQILRSLYYISSFKDFKRYIFPRIFLDLCDIPRDIVRIIKKRRQL